MTRINKTTSYGRLPKNDTVATSQQKLTRKTGFAYPIGGKEGYYFNKAVGKELMKNNVHQLIKTIQGERVMLPEFGLTVHNQLFENLHELDIIVMTDNIREAFSRYLPSVEVRNVKINDYFHSPADRGGGVFTPDDFPQRRADLDSFGDTLGNSLTITLSLYYKDIDEIIDAEVTI